MKNEFKKIFNSEHEQEFFSPGRINLIGEHIDYNGGLVLPMAIDMGTYGLIKLREDNIIRAYSMNFPQVGIIEFDINNIQNDPQDDWVNYIKGVVDVFIKEGHEIKGGFDILVNGTIPNGSGLSSSASLEVLIGRILIDNNDLDVNDTKLALYAQKAENEFIGVNCGIMDQFIIANGTEAGALKINTDTLEYSVVEFDLKDNVIVILNSNKKRGLVDSAYNERRQSCDNVFAIASHRCNVKTLCELTIEQLNTLPLKKEDYNRAKHAIEENIRVQKTVELLQAGKLNEFGAVLDEGHASLRDLFEVSCAELDFITAGAKSVGAIGARMTGAGFGGCCIALMPRNKVNNLREVVKAYRQAFDLELEYYVVVTSDKTKRIN